MVPRWQETPHYHASPVAIRHAMAVKPARHVLKTVENVRRVVATVIAHLMSPVGSVRRIVAGVTHVAMGPVAAMKTVPPVHRTVVDATSAAMGSARMAKIVMGAPLTAGYVNPAAMVDAVTVRIAQGALRIVGCVSPVAMDSVESAMAKIASRVRPTATSVRHAVTIAVTKERRVAFSVLRTVVVAKAAGIVFVTVTRTAQAVARIVASVACAAMTFARRMNLRPASIVPPIVGSVSSLAVERLWAVYSAALTSLAVHPILAWLVSVSALRAAVQMFNSSLMKWSPVQSAALVAAVAGVVFRVSSPDVPTN
jgi:hypothetical protein